MPKPVRCPSDVGQPRQRDRSVTVEPSGHMRCGGGPAAGPSPAGRCEPGHGGDRSGHGDADRRKSGMHRRDGPAPRQQRSTDAREDGRRADQTSAQGTKCAAAIAGASGGTGRSAARGMPGTTPATVTAQAQAIRFGSRLRPAGRAWTPRPAAGTRPLGLNLPSRQAFAQGARPRPDHGILRLRTIDRNLGRKAMADPPPQLVRVKVEQVWPTDLMSKDGGRYFR